MKNWLLIITVLVMFEGSSIHSNGLGNSQHDLIGVGYQYNNTIVNGATFINTNLHHSTLFGIKQKIYKNFNMSLIRVTGYYEFTKNGILVFPYPSIDIDYKNLNFEFYVIPSAKRKDGATAFILTKSVRF